MKITRELLIVPIKLAESSSRRDADALIFWGSRFTRLARGSSYKTQKWRRSPRTKHESNPLNSVKSCPVPTYLTIFFLEIRKTYPPSGERQSLSTKTMSTSRRQRPSRLGAKISSPVALSGRCFINTADSRSVQRTRESL